MDYLEEFINNSWRKIPQRFKNRVANLEMTLEDEYKENPKALATFTGIKGRPDKWPCKIAFYRKPLEKDFQRVIDKVMIHELAHYFGFDEKEAYELMSKKL